MVEPARENPHKKTHPGYMLKSENFDLIFVSGNQTGQDNFWAEEDMNWFELMKITLETFEDTGNGVYNIQSKISSR